MNPPSFVTDRPLAVNAIASFAATTGLSEAARRATLALMRAGVRVAIDDRDNFAPRLDYRLPAGLAGLPSGRPYPVDICFLNVNELGVLPPGFFESTRYSIGFWFWESPNLPDEFVARLDLVDEIWVGSTFTREVLASYTDRPVTVIPQVVHPVAEGMLLRHFYGIADDAFLFLFNFDAYSTFARKNPIGVIEAFSRAFSESERSDRVRLVVKSINLRPGTPVDTVFRAALARVNGVLIPEDLTAGQMAALVTGCDAYVSLHRAEGFGLGMSEAMYLGRPVIATAYSGNMDFTDADSACLVGYRPVRLRDIDLNWDPNLADNPDPGVIFADPDLDQAADWMRLLVDDADFRAGVARRGQQVIRSRYSEECAGQVMAGRLSEIAATLG